MPRKNVRSYPQILIRWLRHAHPLGNGLPIRVVFGFKLPSAGVEGIATTLGCERMQQENAGARVTGGDEVRDTPKIEPGLFLRPGCASG